MYKYEIERKFIIKNIPKNIKVKEKRYINQFYIPNTNKDSNRIMRDRRIYSVAFENNSIKYFYSTKKGIGLIREEKEIEISSEIFFNILKSYNSTPIVKIRNFIQDNLTNLLIEVDQFINYPLTLVEVEFKNEEQAKNFSIPSWFGEEKTKKFDYTNKYIWENIQSVNH